MSAGGQDKPACFIIERSLPLNSIKRYIAVFVIVACLLPIGVSAAEPLSFANELETAEAFADMLERGENTLRLNAPSDFDYMLCYRYLSMLYRDAYVFEYIPSTVNAYIRIVYNDKDKHLKAEAEAERLAGELLNESMSDYEKYFAIHSYLLENCEYDMHAALNQATETGDAFSAYGALVDGKAVCDGISAAFAMICRYAGLPCIYVASPEMNHSWNAVLYKGEVMYIDTTFDLTGGTADEYFIVGEQQLSSDHQWDAYLVKNLTDDIWDNRFIGAYSLSRVGGLFRGSDKGWELDRQPTRAEAAIMLVRFLGLESEALNGENVSEMPFKDINPAHAPYIALLYKLGLTNGTSETTFSPDKAVSLNDYMTFMLRALGYSESEAQFAWESAPEDALGLGIIDGLEYDYISSLVFDRGVMAYVSLLTLTASDPNGIPLCDRLVQAGVIEQKKLEEIFF